MIFISPFSSCLSDLASCFHPPFFFLSPPFSFAKWFIVMYSGTMLGVTHDSSLFSHPVSLSAVLFLFWKLFLFSCPSSLLLTSCPSLPSSFLLASLLFITINNMRLLLALTQPCSLSSPAGCEPWPEPEALGRFLRQQRRSKLTTESLGTSQTMSFLLECGLPFFLLHVDHVIFPALLFGQALKHWGLCLTSFHPVPAVSWWQGWGKRGKVGQF